MFGKNHAPNAQNKNRLLMATTMFENGDLYLDCNLMDFLHTFFFLLFGDPNTHFCAHLLTRIQVETQKTEIKITNGITINCETCIVSQAMYRIE